jgi:hypothetical protein
VFLCSQDRRQGHPVEFCVTRHARSVPTRSDKTVGGEDAERIDVPQGSLLQA